MSRIITGRVSSNKSHKTIVVTVSVRKIHSLYKKQYTQHQKFMAHDANNEAKTGDLVAIRESRPISARKRFILDKIIERSELGFEETVATADVPLEELEKKQTPQPAPKPKVESKKAPQKKPAGKQTQEENR